MTEEIILLIVLLLLSGFFSGSEIAYVVANKLKIEVKARKKSAAAKSAKYFVSNPQSFFSTILIGYNVINIALASLSAVFLTEMFGWGEFSILLVSTFFILIFGEILPKYFARESADRVVFLTALPLRFFYLLFYPVVKVASLMSDRLTKPINVESEAVYHLFSREDIKGLMKESSQAGEMDEKESDIIEKVLDLGEQRVSEAMTPRTEIVGLEVNQTVEEAIELFISSGFSKLPVYVENLDNIKGIILAKDIFKSPGNLKSIIRDVSFIPETKKSLDVMNEFLDKKISIAIVVDEFGGTAGIVTIEDILEELFGEIEDEYDTEEEICRRISPDTYIISGKVEIDYINEKYDLNIEEGDYETLAGFITTKLGRIPSQGEVVKIDNFNILITRATVKKIELVKLSVNPS